MPSQIGISLPNSITYNTYDAAEFARMPVWMVEQEHAAYDTNQVYGPLFDSLAWKQNNGDIVLGVMPQHSPIVSQTHRPANITEQALVNTYRNRELHNQARVKRHKYMSQQINWLPDFRDFRKNIDFAIKDVARQISIGNDFFIRDQLFQQARHAYVVGHTGGTPYLETVPFGEATPTTAAKDANWLAAQADRCGSGTLDFKTLCAIRDLAQNDLGIAPWDGWSKGNPADNEIVKGKWMLVGANELLTRLTYDATINSVRPLAMNLLNSRFNGVLSDNIVFKTDPRPWRFATDGSFMAPEVEQEYDDPTAAGAYGNKGYIIRPNPSYRTAPFGIAFLIGYNPAEAIDVGPPPSIFTGKGISLNKLNALNWNGQVQATRNFLIQQSDGSYEANTWDEYIKLIASTVHGLMPVFPFHVLPIIYKRDMNAALSWV